MISLGNVWIRLYCLLFRKSIVRRVKHDPISSWRLLRTILASSRTIYSGVTGPSGILTIQAELMDVLARTGTEAETLFWQNLSSPDPILAGYCLDGLGRLGSERLGALPEELFQRKEHVRFVGGCFAMALPLGELAKLTVENWKKYAESPEGANEESHH